MINRPYFRLINQASTAGQPTSKLTPPNLEDLRQRILRSLLYSTSILGMIALIPAVAQRLRQGNPAMAFIFIGAFAFLMVLTFVQRIPYRGRAYGFIFLVALLGFATFFNDGLYGNGKLFLLVLPVLSSLLLGGREGFTTLVISILVMIATGVLMLTNQITVPEFGPEDGNANPTFWVVAVTTFALVGGAVVISLYSLLTGLGTSLAQAKQMAGTLDIERSQLEHRILQRTQEIERRLVQIRTAAEISRSITVSLSRDFQSPDLQESTSGSVDANKNPVENLLQRVVDLVQDRFELYYVGIFLVDESGQNAVLKAGTGDAGKKLLEAGHHLVVNDQSMIGWAIHHRQARIALDLAGSSTPLDLADQSKRSSFTITHFNNPLLPETRSEVALPLLSGENALGAMTVQSERAKAFDQDDITVLQGIADTLTAALENTRLFQEAEENLDEIRTLNRQYFVDAWRAASRLPEFHSAEYIAIESDEEQLIEDETPPGSVQGEEVTRSEEAQPVISSIPLTLREQSIGNLALERETPLTAEELSMVKAVATEAALALENVRLLEQSHRRAAQERLLSEIARQVRGSTDIDTILSITVRELGQALSASSALIRLDMADQDISPGDQSKPTEEGQ